MEFGQTKISWNWIISFHQLFGLDFFLIFLPPLCFIETKLAIIPGAGGTQRLPRIVGIPLAKELIFTAKMITGKEAAGIRLVNHSVPQNENGDAAFEKALEVADQILPNGPVGVKMGKIAVNKGIDVSVNKYLIVHYLTWVFYPGKKTVLLSTDYAISRNN